MGTRVVVNVKDFGAVGDGVADDTAAINSAIASIPSGGDELYFPPGLYSNDGFSLPRNTNLAGNGVASALRMRNPGTMISLIGSPAGSFDRFSCHIHDLRLESVLTVGQGGGSTAILLKDVEMVNITDVRMVGYDKGMVLSGSNTATSGVIRCHFWRNWLEGCHDKALTVEAVCKNANLISFCGNTISESSEFALHGEASVDAVYRQWDISSNDFATSNKCISLLGGMVYSRIANNWFETGNASYFPIILGASGTPSSVTAVSITGNIFSGTNTLNEAISITPNGQLRGVTIANNQCTGFKHLVKMVKGSSAIEKVMVSMNHFDPGSIADAQEIVIPDGLKVSPVLERG